MTWWSTVLQQGRQLAVGSSLVTISVGSSGNLCSQSPAQQPRRCLCVNLPDMVSGQAGAQLQAGSSLPLLSALCTHCPPCTLWPPPLGLCQLSMAHHPVDTVTRHTLRRTERGVVSWEATGLSQSKYCELQGKLARVYACSRAPAIFTFSNNSFSDTLFRRKLRK